MTDHDQVWRNMADAWGQVDDEVLERMKRDYPRSLTGRIRLVLIRAANRALSRLNRVLRRMAR
jgi:hypothetical protein